MSTNDAAPETDPAGQEPSLLRAVQYEYSRELPRVLDHLGCALLVSTYQAGKLGVVGVRGGELTFAFHNFQRVMGVAVAPRRIAVGTRSAVYFLQPAHELAAGVEPRGTRDAVWLTRSSRVTGNIHGHELAWGTDGLWQVNTLFSCLCTLDEDYSFVPRWRPPFISELAGQDRCHLNGVAMHGGRPRFVTAHAETNEPAGWRPNKATSGCVIDVASGQTVVRGLCMPHSPRWYDGRLWALDSGTGRMVCIAPDSGQVQTVERFPGYCRGMAFHGRFAFVGLSKIRETSVFGGVPIAERRSELRCGVAVVDMTSGRTVAWLQFHSGVEEVFAVEVLPGCRNPALAGPNAEEDGTSEIWVVPPEGKIPPGAGRHADGAGSEHGSLPNLASPGIPAGRSESPREALARLQAASAAAPDRADLLNELGNAHQQVGDQAAAMDSYRRAVQAQPGYVPARQNLGYLLVNHGEPEQALVQYEEALRHAPSPMNRILAATVLPVIYESADDVAHWRGRIAQGVRALCDEGVRIDTARAMVPTSFFLAYQGENDREVARDLGRIYQGVDMAPAPPRQGTQRMRIGFVSAYFRDHTIGRLNLGRVRHLSREEFEVTVIYAGQQGDEVTREFALAADHVVAVPRDIAAARQQIAALGLDVLLFADVGMDALTSTLVFSRMAPVQCVTWGHPDTTGSPAIDYFISSELLETSEGDSHYTERLVRLPNLGTYYQRPARGKLTRTRAFFGLDDRRHVYLCPQTLFKFHPEFDPFLKGVLDADPEGDVVLLEGRVANWTDRLRRRLDRTLGKAAERVRFLPAQPHDDFMELLALADVSLDPFPFGGGNTTYEALAVGTPVVTCPSPHLRGRITLALYRKMGWTDCVADSMSAYVAQATRLACDGPYRQQIRERIRVTSPVLFEDLEEVRSLESFFRSLLPVAHAARVRTS